MSDSPSDSFAVRLSLPDEWMMVAANWKADLSANRHLLEWARGLQAEDYWRIVNYALDRITLQSVTVYVGHHVDSSDVPLCWAAVREGLLLYMYVKRGIRKNKDVAEMVRSSMLRKLPVVAIQVQTFNPFQELERP